MIDQHPNASYIKVNKNTIPLSEARMFFEKGLHCHECGISGDEFKLSLDINKKSKLDLFSTENNKIIILDLIIPKKYHGVEQEFNLIPLCSECYTRLYDKVKVDWITPEVIEWVGITFGMDYLNQIIDDNIVSVETEDFE
jgi:5-methylcytosine-specific restriction endonuclease McrA